MAICHKNNIKVYGVNTKGKMFVVVEEKTEEMHQPKKTPSKHLHNSSESLNEAVEKTYVFYANKIIGNQRKS